jgi:hypothetical protein
MTLANKIYAGDTLEYGVDVPDFLPADGWTLKVVLVPRFATPTQAPITLTATAGPITVDETEYDYAVQVTPATTALWVAGLYGFASYVEKSGARVTLEGTQYQGEVLVRADPTTAVQGADMRSPSKKALDDALQALYDAQVRAADVGTSSSSGAIVEYRIGDRMVKYSTAAEAAEAVGVLLSHIAFLRSEVGREQNAEGLSKGRVNQRRTYLRFSNA